MRATARLSTSEWGIPRLAALDDVPAEMAAAEGVVTPSG